MILVKKTASQFASLNPTLTKNQLGVESDTNFVKRGDGTTAWNNLIYSDYFIPRVTSAIREVYKPTGKTALLYDTDLNSHFKFSPQDNDWSPL